jgi:hypothetical protein
MLEIFDSDVGVIILQKVARLKDRLMNTMYHHGGTPPGPEGPNVYKLGRRAADCFMIHVSFFLEEVDEPPPVKSDRDYIEGQDVVALGGQTVFVRPDWLRKNAPYALEA